MKTILTLTMMGALAAQAAPFGEQISDTGIRHSFLLTGTRTILVDENSEITWELKQKSRDGAVLANGNFLIAFGDSVKEFNKEKEVVFQYKLSSENQEIGTAQRLESGNTLITELGKKPRLLEVTKGGEIAVEVPLKPDTDNAHMQTRMARKMPGGNYLVPHLLAFAVKEYSPKGEVVRTIKTDLPELGGRERKNWPFTAILLDEGRVMVNLTNGNQSVIFDKDGKVDWRATNEDVDGRFADPCGGQVLENGNLVVCAYGSPNDDKPDLFEVSSKKKVVWEFKAPGFRGAHEVHILTTNGKPVAGKR